MLCAILLAAGLSLSGRVNAAFISGVWQGDANYDTEGKFSDCTMTAQASSGVLIGFIISKGFEWGLVLADETREFEVGTTESVALHIDQREPIPAIAKVIDVHGIVIPLENSERVLDALREGEVLTIVAKRANISFKLTGTKAAIAALAACVTESLNRRLRDQRRENSFSMSASLSSIWVGRPWLHCPVNGVLSMSRSSAFISSGLSRRPARTLPWQAMVDRT